ncbi:hypothetical protein AV521_02360 [Streptomyces sp. IMTB 2501]|uniref:hypothetical protein n=1 Tax=Streptomyces sp. IMTB 2501 TaxID=1776340 RepID=UPI00096CBCB1|nr:hypothetical protein [Streptomyces sp. IMTB 2501]OLZ74503.1 hypothetical protein AV521_02360 [Streptomyces sp. IMTB 2501]
MALLAVTCAFTEGGRSGPGAPEVLVAACFGIAALAGLAVAEVRRGDTAMVPPALLRRWRSSSRCGTGRRSRQA